MTEPDRALDPTAPASAPAARLAPRVRNSRVFQWAVAVGAAVIAALGIVLLFLLAQATDNRDLYERNYQTLFIVNVAAAAMLLATIAWMAVRLLSRLRRGKFGSRLLVRLALIFALVGLAPGLLIYVVSYQFVSRSIESWFDVRVEGALDAGLSLGRASIDARSGDLVNKTRNAASQLSGVSDAGAGLVLERLRDQLGAGEVNLWSSSGQLIAGAGPLRFQLAPDRLTSSQLRAVRTQRTFSAIEGLEEASVSGAAGTAPAIVPRVRVLVLAPPATLGLLSDGRVLEVTQALPSSLVANAIAVQEANREYQERALGREGLRRMYIGTLTLSLVLAVFGAILLAVVLGNSLARPLLLLAAGVREVAAGDLSPKPVLQSKDELGGLTRSFAQMTQQLADARAAVDRSIGQVDAARANLQTIQDNLTAGIIVLDDQGCILSCNPGATRILRAPLAACVGKPLVQVEGLQAFGDAVTRHFDEYHADRQHGLDHWQQSFELGGHMPGSPLGNHEAVTVVVRGADMPADAGGRSAHLLVLDDISEIVSAQRARAWGEVARRLAHEIKNPLTPIQLSAERLAMKLEGKVAEPERVILAKSVRTIVDQVDAMKRLVNEFRDYARLPAAELRPVDLNELVNDVLQLYGRETGDPSAASSAALVPVRLELDPACPSILGDAMQLRQVIHNLLQNAQDATDAVSAGTGPHEVVLRTQWIEGSNRVRLVVNDSGCGFPEHILKRAFEPYVTTKPRGTGLGLAVVKKIADEHGARIDLKNRLEEGRLAGAQVSLSFSVAA